MYKPSVTHQSNSKRYIYIACALLVAAVIGVIAYNALRSKPDNQAAGTRPANNVNLDKPTPEEVQAGDTQKDRNIEREKVENTPPPASPSGTADLRITDASQYEDVIEVRAFVANIYEAGTCTVVFTKSGQPSVTTTSQAFKDVSTTQCGANDTARSKFSVTGNWQATVTYSSPSGTTGTADKAVTIK